MPPQVVSTPTGAIYEIDSAHSAAHFSVRHLMISNVKGEFSKVTGTVVYDPNNVGAARVNATIDATTINTRDEQRDAHLRTADFFDTEKYPTLTFKSTHVSKSKHQLRVTGDLDDTWCHSRSHIGCRRPDRRSKRPMGKYESWGDRFHEDQPQGSGA